MPDQRDRAFDKITLLRNSAGMFIIQRIKEEYEGEHGAIGWEELNSLGDCHEGWLHVSQRFQIFQSRHMSDEIWNYLVKTGQASEKRLGYNHMQLSKLYGAELCLGDTGLEEIMKEKDTVYMVKRRLAECKAVSETADATGGKKVVTGARKARP